MPEWQPLTAWGMDSGTVEEQMTMRQPAAVARRAAVSLVAIPPVPHSVPAVVVSTCCPDQIRKPDVGCILAWLTSFELPTLHLGMLLYGVAVGTDQSVMVDEAAEVCCVQEKTTFTSSL